MDAYYVIGGVLAGWALLVSLLGVVRHGFPSSSAGENAVIAVSVVLVAATIGAAVIGSMNAEHGDESEEHAGAAQVLSGS